MSCTKCGVDVLRWNDKVNVLEAQLKEAKDERDAVLRHEWPRTIAGLENDVLELQDQLQAANERIKDLETDDSLLAFNREKHRYESELTQLRQERDKLQKQLDEGSSDVLDALATERDTLRAEVEHLKYQLDVYHDQATRMQELEGALKEIMIGLKGRFVPKDIHNIAKRALDGGKE